MKKICRFCNKFSIIRGHTICLVTNIEHNAFQTCDNLDKFEIVKELENEIKEFPKVNCEYSGN